jgi:hypothetical protein
VPPELRTRSRQKYYGHNIKFIKRYTVSYL